MFFGYPPGMKGYKLYDIESKKIFVSRDIIFHEEVFPFHSVVVASTLTDPFPDLVLPTPLREVPISTYTHDPTPSSEVHSSSSHCLHDVHSPIIPLPESPSSPSLVPVRKSFKIPHPPSYLRDFHCNLSSLTDHPALIPSRSMYLLGDFLAYDSLSHSHRTFVLNVSSQFEPQFYHQAIHFPH